MSRVRALLSLILFTALGIACALSACTPPEDRSASTRESIEAGNAKLKALKACERSLNKEHVWLEKTWRTQGIPTWRFDRVSDESQAVRKLLEEYVALAGEVEQIASQTDVVLAGREEIKDKATYARKFIEYFDELAKKQKERAKEKEKEDEARKSTRAPGPGSGPSSEARPVASESESSAVDVNNGN